MKIEYVTHSGSDLLVVNAARASFGKEVQELSSKDVKLINFLAREKHLLPFRHPILTLRCKAPIFVARQLGKHQVGMSWSEESRRYVKTDPEFYWPDKWRKAAAYVKQGSSDEEANVNCLSVEVYAGQTEQVTLGVYEAVDVLLDMYGVLIRNDVAPEQARMILPQNMMITWVWTGTLLSWIHLLHERLAPTTQKETRDFAALVAEQVQKYYPESYKALMNDQGRDS